MGRLRGDVSRRLGDNLSLFGEIVSIFLLRSGTRLPIGEVGRLLGDVSRRFGETLSLFGDALSLFGDDLSLFGDALSLFGEVGRLLGDVSRRFGEALSLFGDVLSLFGGVLSLFGDALSRFGDVSTCLPTLFEPLIPTGDVGRLFGEESRLFGCSLFGDFDALLRDLLLGGVLSFFDGEGLRLPGDLLLPFLKPRRGDGDFFL